MIGWAFNQLYLAGDVIYGISQPRERYVDTLPQGILGRTGRELMDEGNFLICDHYNNRTFNAPTVMGHFRGPNAQAGENAMDFWHTNSPIRNNQPQVQAVKQYYDLLAGHKYNPHTAMNTVMNEKKRLNNNGQSDYLAFRRACKFGLDYFILQMNRRVHFILDVDNNGTCIDYEPIVFKQLYVNVNNGNQRILPITYSELRKCYKNRLLYGNKLFFYLNAVRVQAPWDQEPDLWAMIDVAKNIQQNAQINMDQNGREDRANHVVVQPKPSRAQRFIKVFRKNK
ncbi:MAG: hypothetical protein EAZ91_20895 [Cytophagales bacterium]|nr:MAG: hypothetical protein EAZ91_20895 [Cytophagales bacterium]